MCVIDFPVACAYCGASLEGCRIDSGCTGCERQVGQTLNLSVLDEASLSIKADVPCASCGYNLRTQRLDKVCPECARPVIASLPPHPLIAADKGWLRRVFLGSQLLLTSLLLPEGVTRCFAAYGLVPPGFVPTYIWVFIVFLIVLWVIGVFLVTAIDPIMNRSVVAGRSQKVALIRRDTARIGTILWAMYGIAQGIQGAIDVPLWTSLMEIRRYHLAIIDVGAFIISNVALALCLKALAQRTPHNTLARLMNWWIGITISVGTLTITTEVSDCFSSTLVQPLRELMKVSSFVYMGLGFIILLWTLIVIRGALNSRRT